MTILKKLYLNSHEQVIQDIFELYTIKSVFVNYLYFANVMHQRLLENSQDTYQQKYLKSLEYGDFLLTDGIALQLFYRFGKLGKGKFMPENINGTKLFPEILTYLKDLQKGGKKIHMTWYSVYDDDIGKSKKEAIKAEKIVYNTYGLKVNLLFQSSYQRRGRDFDRGKYEISLGQGKYDIRVFCNFIGTPLQEIRTEEYRNFFEKNHILVLNQGGTIDFLSGFEHVAPSWVVKSRVLETFWRIFHNPKKNFKKFLWMFGIVRYRLWFLKTIFYQEFLKSSGK